MRPPFRERHLDDPAGEIVSVGIALIGCGTVFVLGCIAAAWVVWKLFF